MAEQTRDIKITWENDNKFEMKTRLDSGAWIIIVRAEENGEIPKLWNSIQSICEKFISVKLEEIGTEMKS
jgi:nitrogen fixation protein FixH